jgi:hypothetical protein
MDKLIKLLMMALNDGAADQEKLTAIKRVQAELATKKKSIEEIIRDGKITTFVQDNAEHILTQKNKIFELMAATDILSHENERLKTETNRLASSLVAYRKDNDRLTSETNRLALSLTAYKKAASKQGDHASQNANLLKENARLKAELDRLRVRNLHYQDALNQKKDKAQFQPVQKNPTWKVKVADKKPPKTVKAEKVVKVDKVAKVAKATRVWNADDIQTETLADRAIGVLRKNAGKPMSARDIAEVLQNSGFYTLKTPRQLGSEISRYHSTFGKLGIKVNDYSFPISFVFHK